MKLISYTGKETKLFEHPACPEMDEMMGRGILQPLEFSLFPRKQRKQINASLKKSLRSIPLLFRAKRLYINESISINGIPVDGVFIDTGCTVSILTKKLAMKCGLISLIDTEKKMSTPGFKYRTSMGLIHACSVQIGEDTMYSAFNVFSEEELAVHNIDIILGLNILNQFNFIIDIENFKFTVGNTGTEINIS